MSDFAVIYGYVAGDQAHSLPIEEPQPGTLDAGLFYAPDNSKGTLLSANLFCANPSCPHIFGPYFSQAVSMIADHRYEELQAVSMKAGTSNTLETFQAMGFWLVFNLKGASPSEDEARAGIAIGQLLAVSFLDWWNRV